MNNKLVALAVAGACALPLTAQAQTANVTLYGRINVDAEVIINQKQIFHFNIDDQGECAAGSRVQRVGVRGDAEPERSSCSTTSSRLKNAMTRRTRGT